MSRDHLKRSSHKITGTKHAWWYEEEKSMTVVVHHNALIDGYGAAEIKIPWKYIRAALARLEKK